LYGLSGRRGGQLGLRSSGGRRRSIRRSFLKSSPSQAFWKRRTMRSGSPNRGKSLNNLFDLDNSQVESTACKFEHILTKTVTESVCTFLGHPPVCPHGRPIPRGECCDKIRTEIKPLVTRLADAVLSEEVRIVFITPKSRKRLEKLSSLGIVPGSPIRLIQRNPSFVLEIGETTVAVDKDITDDIYVKRT
jgi:DtxR family Mn-dependent transcriptional regulator